MAEAEPAPVAAPEPVAMPEPAQDDLAGRIAALEARLDEQDVALRRVLTLLVDWAEGEQSPNVAAPHAAEG